jgi:beta-lactamase class A
MKIFKLAVIILMWCFSNQISIAEPLTSYPTLWESGDVLLQQGLEKLVKKQGLWKHVKKKNLSLVVVDITDLNNPKLAEINGNKMFYAASLPKIAILLAAFVEIELGNLQESDELYTHMLRMIRYSDNKSASLVLSIVGGERIIEILQYPDFALYDPEHNGGLWLGKAYAEGAAYHRDPLHNLSHGATAIQAARFYYLLETHRLLNSELSKKMKAILSKPGIQHKFVKGLNSIPGIKIYRKSGSWKNYHADSALVEYGKYKYIVIGLSDSASGGRWIEQLAVPVHELVLGRDKL